MSIASQAQRLVIDVDRKGNPIRWLWNQLQSWPAGTRLFSKLVGQAAPYSGTMGAHIVELRKGFSRVTMADRRKVRNHLNCVHAVALVNLAELTGNVAMAYALPDDARFIVSGLSIEYLKKARGRITGECQCPVPTSSEQATYEIPVELKNDAGEVVARATLQSLVGPKKSQHNGATQA